MRRRWRRAIPAILSFAGRAALKMASRPLRLAKTVLLLAAFLLVANEIVVARSANGVLQAVLTRQLPDLEDTWKQFDDLNARSHLRFGVLGLRRGASEVRQPRAAA